MQRQAQPQSHEVRSGDTKWCIQGRVFMSAWAILQMGKPATYDTKHLHFIWKLLLLYRAQLGVKTTPLQCVWSVCAPIDSVWAHKRAAAEGDMSIYNLENSHLIVFDRRSLQINKSTRHPHVFIHTYEEANKHTYTHAYCSHFKNSVYWDEIRVFFFLFD